MWLCQMHQLKQSVSKSSFADQVIPIAISNFGPLWEYLALSHLTEGGGTLVKKKVERIATFVVTSIDKYILFNMMPLFICDVGMNEHGRI